MVIFFVFVENISHGFGKRNDLALQLSTCRAKYLTLVRSFIQKREAVLEAESIQIGLPF